MQQQGIITQGSVNFQIMHEIQVIIETVSW